LSIATNRNHIIDSSLVTSPFNSNPHETLNSSELKSPKNIYSNEEQNWNEEELYELSNENSKVNNLQEIVDIETPGETSENSEREQTFGNNYDNENIKKYIPHHQKGKSSIYSQNSNDLNRIPNKNLREAPQEVIGSHKLSEILFRSNQASVNEQFRSIRFSGDQIPSNYLLAQSNMNGSDKPTLEEQVRFAASATPEMGDVPSTVDFQYTNSKEPTEEEEEEYEGLNFEEYRKNATSPGEPDSQNENKLTISDEQRENLMKRIMLLKIQKTQNESHHNEVLELSSSFNNSEHNSPK